MVTDVAAPEAVAVAVAAKVWVRARGVRAGLWVCWGGEEYVELMQEGGETPERCARCACCLDGYGRRWQVES